LKQSNEIVQKIFYHRYTNDDNGCPAYDPALLLKIIILAYSKGITTSRKIEALCRENIIFMAISADSQPHFTTIADFISRSHLEIACLFKQVLLICDERTGISGKPVKSNITDNDSAKMKTRHGVIQGYNGVAAVDDKHQIIMSKVMTG